MAPGNIGQIRCKSCWKLVKSIGGLGRHKCKPQPKAPIPKRRRLRSASTSSVWIPYVTNTTEYYGSTQHDKCYDEDVRECRVTVEGCISGVFEPFMDVHQITEDAVDDETIKLTAAAEQQNEYASVVVDVGYNEIQTSGSSEGTRLVHFAEDTDTKCFPGQPVAENNLEPGETPKAPPPVSVEDPWWPFVSKHDWNLASWFARARCGKGSIEDYLQEPEFATRAREQKGAIKTYADLMRATYAIPYGIPGGDFWLERKIIVPGQVKGAEPQLHTVIFRPIQQCLEFLLSHKPFASDMVWAPVKKYYGISESRVYDEMHTGNWWWNKQSELPPGATIVPVILASDKTLMTQLRGDQTAWPLYITIGNLKRSVRRKQTVPSTLLLGFLPISKVITKASDQEMSYEVKSALYHLAMSIILEPLEELTKSGWLVHCADSYIRHCYPIIANMLCDYQEVTLITGIKTNEQCGTCQVPPTELQSILKQWPLRTHQQMRDQMQKQKSQKVNQSDQNWVHDINSFAWRHSFLNIHESIAVDMLHQLQKGVFRDLVRWTMDLVKDLVLGQRATKTKKKKDRSYKESPGLVQLDARFELVPRFPGLRHFNHFSHVQQWTGNEERDLLRIIIPVITPLLLPKAPHALAYARALIDFITLVQYRTHNDYTLRYISQAIFRIDNTKEAFAKYRPKDCSDEAHWNYPKFHSISHYVTFIMNFGAPNGFDSENSEAAHKFLLKDFYDRTNKTNTFLQQIASWNTRETNRKAMDHILLHHFGTSSQEGVEIEAQVTSMSRTPLKVGTLCCQTLPRETQIALRSLRLDLKTTTTAYEAQRATGLKGFVAALALFVRRSRIEVGKKKGEVRPVDNNQSDECETDSTWIHDYPVQFFGSLRCWRRTGKDETDTEAQEPELLRCAPNWMGRGPREDYCWVQENPPTKLRKTPGPKDPPPPDNPLNGQRIGQIRALIKVVDINFLTEHSGYLPLEYCAALVDIYPFKDRGIPHPVHGMIEVLRSQVPTVENPRKLKCRRFYSLPTVLRSAHIIPSSYNVESKPTDMFYINNYIDWDQYQVLYEEDWEEKGYQRARQIKKHHDLATKKARAAAEKRV